MGNPCDAGWSIKCNRVGLGVLVPYPNDPKNEKKPARVVRVRSRRLDQIDEAKLALALSLMARRLIEERDHTADPVVRDAAAAAEWEVA